MSDADVRTQLRNRLHELAWMREQVQHTKAEARRKVKVFHADTSRRGRYREEDQSPDVAAAIQLMQDCDRDLRRLSEEINQLRQELNARLPGKFARQPRRPFTPTKGGRMQH